MARIVCEYCKSEWGATNEQAEFVDGRGDIQQCEACGKYGLHGIVDANDTEE